MQVKQIETYSLYEFCQAVEQAVLDGYRFDFDSNSRFPQAFGSLMTAGMVKVNEEQLVTDALEQIYSDEMAQVYAEDQAAQEPELKSEVKPVVKPGRKPRG